MEIYDYSIKLYFLSKMVKFLQTKPVAVLLRRGKGYKIIKYHKNILYIFGVLVS